jgi:hypothetical protein
MVATDKCSPTGLRCEQDAPNERRSEDQNIFLSESSNFGTLLYKLKYRQVYEANWQAGTVSQNYFWLCNFKLFILCIVIHQILTLINTL